MKRKYCKFYLIRKKIGKNKKTKFSFEKKILLKNAKYKPNLFIKFSNNILKKYVPINFNYTSRLIYHSSYPRPKTNQTKKITTCICLKASQIR